MHKITEIATAMAKESKSASLAKTPGKNGDE
jgi:hypothetical protein